MCQVLVTEKYKVVLHIRDITFFFICAVLGPGNMQIPYIFTCKTFNMKVLYVYAHKVPYFSIYNTHLMYNMHPKLMYNAHPKLMYTAHVHFLRI